MCPQLFVLIGLLTHIIKKIGVSLLLIISLDTKIIFEGFPGDPVVKNPPCNAGGTGQSLVHKDPTCHRATKPVSHNY